MLEQQDRREGVGGEGRLQACQAQLREGFFGCGAVLMEDAQGADDQVQMFASLADCARQGFEGVFIPRIAIDPLQARAMALGNFFQLCRSAGLSRYGSDLSHVIALEQRRA